MGGDDAAWPAETELDERLLAIEAVVERFVGVNEVEHMLVDLLDLLKSNRLTREQGVTALTRLATDWPIGADEVLEFCLRELQWAELHELITNQAAAHSDFRIRDRAKRVLEVYERRWPAGDIYRTYRADELVRGRTVDELYAEFTAAIEGGSDDVDRRHRLMVAIATALDDFGSTPAPVADLLEPIVACWRSSQDPEPRDLQRAKSEVWRTLDARNDGNSTAIRDNVDRSLRAALCLTELTAADDLLDTAGWAAEMLATDPWPRQTKYF